MAANKILPPNFDPFADPQLDDYEKELEASFERDDWQSVPDLGKRKEEMKKNVEYTQKLRKNRNINLRLQEGELLELKKRAKQKGLPYQTLISSLIHQYVTGQIQVKL